MNTYKKRFCKSKFGSNKISTTFVCANKKNIVNFANLIEDAIIDINIKDFTCNHTSGKKKHSKKVKI